jgi:hypothetical protein
MIFTCANCGTTDLQMSAFLDREGNFIGQWPLRYWGAKPTEPMNAEAYFCGPSCANLYVKKHHQLHN